MGKDGLAELHAEGIALVEQIGGAEENEHQSGICRKTAPAREIGDLTNILKK